MYLPRPASIFDAPPKKVARFHAPLSDAPLDVTECSDAAFDAWLGDQFPSLDAPHPAFEHKRFNDDMLHTWMKLTTAATKAQVKYTQDLWEKNKTRRPEEWDFGPQYSSGMDESGGMFGGITDEGLNQLQDEWLAEQNRIEAMRQKPLTLVARAEMVQTKISLVV